MLRTTLTERAWRAVVLGVILLAATGCASSAFAEGLLTPQEVDEPVRMLFCPSLVWGRDSPRVDLDRVSSIIGGTGVIVEVPIVIGVDGTVLDVGFPSSSRLVPQGFFQRSTEFHGDALHHARGCLFEPAQLDSRPVPLRGSVVFWFPD